MDIALGSDGCIGMGDAPKIKFTAGTTKDCTTCKFDASYEEMKKGITCKAKKECIDNKQWNPRKYKSYQMSVYEF